MLTAYIDIIVREHRHDPLRRTAPESRMSEEHIADLCTCESIDILRRRDALSHTISIDMCWEWCLDEESVDTLISREILDLGFECLLIARLWEAIPAKSHTHLTCTFFFHADICLRGWIVSDEDDSEHRLVTSS